MPSGKQISFENGEISPSLRFRTSLAAYATGLSKLKNMTVRKSGGVSNRPGFEFVAEPGYQLDQRQRGRVRIFGATLPDKNDETIETDFLILSHFSTGVFNRFELFGKGFNGTLLPANLADTDLTNVKVSQLGNQIIFSNGDIHWVLGSQIGVSPFLVLETLPDTILTFPPPAIAILTTAQGIPDPFSAINRPVSYLVMAVFKRGEEVFFFNTNQYTPGNVVNGVVTPSLPIEPISQGGVSSYNILTIPLTPDTLIKHYDVYRAPMSEDGLSFGQYGLVGRIPNPSVNVQYKFHDYISSADITHTPPIETYLYGTFLSEKSLVSARLIGHAGQRRIVVVNPETSRLDEGSVAVSKLGVYDQMDTHPVFTDTGAFDFTIPIGEKQRIVATLELRKLILLTTEAIVVAQGGDNGILTPTQVNPQVISRIGCSEKVTPVSNGAFGFFMSPNEEKLMGIRFDERQNAEVFDISVLSDHILEGARVAEMALVGGREDILWLLKTDGTLVSVTLHANGEATGWAVHETDGFIESITSLEQQVNFTDTGFGERYKALYISVIRKNAANLDTRYIEKITFRDDTVKEQWRYMDALMTFGSRLFFAPAISAYVKPIDSILGVEQEDHLGRPTHAENVVVNVPPIIFNIEDVSGTWDQTVDITVKNLTGGGNFQDPLIEKQVIDFYYDEKEDPNDSTSKIITKTIRWTQTGFVDADEATGRFNGPVPLQLQNVDGAALLANEKIKLQTRWARVKNKIIGLSHLAGKEVSVFADGIVLSSPNNPSMPTLTVNIGGFLILDDYYAWGAVGLPYTSEMETLDLDTSDNRTFTDSKKLVNKVGIAFHETKGGFVGQHDKELTQMEELRTRQDETLEEVTKNVNEHISVNIPSEWEQTGRVLIKQVDPLPMTVLAVYPKGIVGD